MRSWRKSRSRRSRWKLLGPERRREAVRHLQRVLGVSERFASRVTMQHRSTQRHKPIAATPDDPDAALRDWLRQYAKAHPRRVFRPAYHEARAEGSFAVDQFTGSGQVRWLTVRRFCEGVPVQGMAALLQWHYRLRIWRRTVTC